MSLTMEERATDLLAALRNSNLSTEVKTASLAKLKSEIKQKNVPDGAAPIIFESFRAAIASPHSALSSAGFSALGHLVKRLYLQEHHSTIANQGRHIYPLLLERLGDNKERIRTQAAQAFTDFWPVAATEVEHNVLEVGLVAKSPRAKETSMSWLVNMTREHGLLFRTYVPSLVTCLEDADSGVRETAKATVVELFQNAPPRALSDLRKQLQSRNVRKSITSSIFASLGISTADSDLSTSTLSHSKHDTLRPASSFSHRREEIQQPNSVLSVRSHSNHDGLSSSKNDTSQFSKSMKIEHPKKEPNLNHMTSVESLKTVSNEAAEGEAIEPLYVNIQRDIDDLIRDMSPHFEGRESEQNWMHREKSILILRRLTMGNAPHDHQQHYLACVKQLLDGILKAVTSLRTTLSTAGCLLVQEIARVNGSAIDHMVEILLQSLIKLCGALKKIVAQNGNVTVDAVIGNVSYTSRILQHLWNACQDKNVQPRQYVTGWIKTIIAKHGKHKGLIEHSGGLEYIEKCIRKGLGDANPGVREGMRSTYWVFHKIWPESAELIISDLDTKSRNLLEKDPGNPNFDPNAQSFRSSRSAQSHGNSKSSTRMTLKETIAAQKKARLAAAKSVPPRPESAQATFSEPRSARHPVQRQQFSTSVRTVPTGSHVSSQGGSLSSAPMRPAMRPRRPEMARPATADPYSARRSVHPSSRSRASSPSESPQKQRTKTISTTTPRPRNPSARPKSRLDGGPPMSSMKRRPTEPNLATPRQLRGSPVPHDIPATSPARRRTEVPIVSPAKMEEDFQTFPGLRASRQAEPIVPDFVPDSSVFEPDTTAERSTDSPEPLQAPLTRETQTPPPQFRQLSTRSPTPSTPSPSLHQARQDSPEVPVSTSPPHDSPVRDVVDTMQPESPNNVNKISVSVPTESQNSNNLKVYEDPQSPNSKEWELSVPVNQEPSPSPQAVPKSMPLEELPLNEPTVPNRKLNQDVQNLEQSFSSHFPPGENLHRRWKKVEVSERRRSLSPRSKDPTRARDMIDRGLAKIRASALDVHGYRKFQGLIKYHASILSDESKYQQILLALFDALESTDGKSSASNRTLDLKTQVLFTIRVMFSLNRELFATYYARAMTCIITTRKHYEITNHIVSGLEETAEDIVCSCNPRDIIDAVLDLVETEEKSPEGYRVISMGTYVLSGLLRRLNEKNLFLSDPELERLGKLANQNIRNPQPDVRRAVIDFCLELHKMVRPEVKFWAMFNSQAEDFRPLLTYYIMKKPGQV